MNSPIIAKANLRKCFNSSTEDKVFIVDPLSIHKVAIDHGWYDEGTRNVPEVLCLIHSEVSEALEEYRKGNLAGIGEELADVVIRLFDTAVALDIDIIFEIEQKHLKNINRPYRHGGKVC